MSDERRGIIMECKVFDNCIINFSQLLELASLMSVCTVWATYIIREIQVDIASPFQIINAAEFLRDIWPTCNTRCG